MYVEGKTDPKPIEEAAKTSAEKLEALAQQRTAAFRILQETLTNVYRHSGSRAADIRLKRAANAATLEVQDYGHGIPARLLDQFKRTGLGGGVGLSGMRERIEDFDGQLEIISGRAGAVVRATVPVATIAVNCARIAHSVGAVAS